MTFLPQEQPFHTGSFNINYAEVGHHGPPLVLLHGLARNWQDFLPLVPGLAENHRVFALDLRGHGKSGRVAHQYTLEAYASDVVNFLQHRVNTPAILFGHSLGGMVAMRIASDQPKLVRALIAGDTMLARDGFTRSMYFSFFQTLHSLLLNRTSVPDLARRLAHTEIRVPGLDHAVPLGDLPGNDESALLKWAACLDQVDPEAIAMTLSGAAYAAFLPEDWFPRIKCPVLLLQANPDLGGLISDQEIGAARTLLPNSQHQYFPLLGHALHLQQPASVLKTVTSYLATL